jgi:hypothetical protein
MAAKQDFTPEEWAKVLESTMLVGVAVSAADPSGLWGTIKEALASKSAVTTSKFVSSNELVKAVVSDLETSEGRSIVQESMRKHVVGAKPAEIVHRALESLRDVAVVIDQKAPKDSAEFKQFLHGVGQKVAEATTEGGFLGFGGVKVSDAEKATLDDIVAALRKV